MCVCVCVSWGICAGVDSKKRPKRVKFIDIGALTRDSGFNVLELLPIV